jgi:hypothetical protein
VTPVRILIILLLVALTAAKVAAVLALGPVSIELDAWEYWRLSALVMSGDILLLDDPIAYRTPVYPWFLALVRFLAGSYAYLAIVVAQGLFWLASISIAGHIAVRITKLPRAMPLTLLASLPAVSFLTFSATALSESLFVLLLMLHLLAVLDYAKYGTVGRAIWLGVTLALTLLTRPIVLLLWIPHIVFLLCIHDRKRRRLGSNAPGRLKLQGRAVHAVIAALAIGVLIAPWLLRNQYLFGKPFLTEFVGRNVWIVTFQDGSGAGLDLPTTEASGNLKRRLANVGLVDDGWRHTWTTSKALVASGLNDPQADRLMKQVAADAISENKQQFAWKAFRRIANFWRCAATDLPQQGRAEGKYRQQHTWAYDVPPVDWALKYRLSQSVALNTLLTAALGLATVFLILSYPTRPYGIWIALIFAYFSIVTGILEIPAYRYRIVLEPLIAMVFGAAIAVLLSWRRKPAKLQSSGYAKM